MIMNIKTLLSSPIQSNIPNEIYCDPNNDIYSIFFGGPDWFHYRVKESKESFKEESFDALLSIDSPHW